MLISLPPSTLSLSLKSVIFAVDLIVPYDEIDDSEEEAQLDDEIVLALLLNLTPGDDNEEETVQLELLISLPLP